MALEWKCSRISDGLWSLRCRGKLIGVVYRHGDRWMVMPCYGVSAIRVERSLALGAHRLVDIARRYHG